MIPNITPILMALVAINANRAKDDDKLFDTKEGKPVEQSSGKEVDAIFQYFIVSLRVALVFAVVFLIITLISRFLL